MPFKKINQFLFCVLTAFPLTLWTACTVKHADSEIAMPCEDDSCDEKQQENQEYTLAEKELMDNYYLLSVYYLAADEKLADINAYYKHGKNAGFSPDYYEFPDVSYMYSQMGDSYTSYFSPYYAQMYDFDSATDPIYNLSISVENADSMLVVSQVYPGGPGDKAGLKEGDTILFVGKNAPGDIDGFNKLTSGKEGDSLTLKILRDADTLDISATLFCYLTPTVFVNYLDSIPLITITEFQDFSGISCTDANSTTEYKGTMLELKNILKATKGAAVIDVRGNPGGSVEQCISAAELFLSKGDTIAIFEIADVAPDSIHQQIYTETIVATEEGPGKGRYFVFLADTASASCSEMLLAGTTKNRNFPIVGSQTVGKGIGQYYSPTYAGGYSIITAMRSFDKDGKSYHDKGFLPDYDISDPAKALEKALELAKGGKEKRTKGYGTERLHHFDDPFAKTASASKKPLKGGAYKFKKNPRMK